jgi:hypothetical protein
MGPEISCLDSTAVMQTLSGRPSPNALKCNQFYTL